LFSGRPVTLNPKEKDVTSGLKFGPIIDRDGVCAKTGVFIIKNTVNIKRIDVINFFILL